jgi:plasmid stabilization system protein ParE
MNYSLKLGDPVYGELDQIYEWYFVRSPRSAEKFINSIEKLFGLISSNPLLFPLIKTPFRIARLKAFPYIVIYELMDDAIYILRVIHSYRNPKKRFKKLKKTK